MRERGVEGRWRMRKQCECESLLSFVFFSCERVEISWLDPVVVVVVVVVVGYLWSWSLAFVSARTGQLQLRWSSPVDDFSSLGLLCTIQMPQKNPFDVKGWTKEKLPGDDVALVVRHPDHQVVLLYAATNSEHSLLSWLGPVLHLGGSGSSVIDDLINAYNHQAMLRDSVEDHSLTDLKFWKDRMVVWPSNSEHSSVTIKGTQFEKPLFCSFRGAIALLHFLAFHRPNENDRGPQFHDAAVAVAAKTVITQAWVIAADSQHCDNMLKRMFGKQYEKAYSKCADFLRAREWWPPQWGSDAGPHALLKKKGGALPTSSLPLALHQNILTEQYIKDKLSKLVFGQPWAVEAAAKAVAFKISGAANPLCPWVIAFAGPSGHGKTHLGKQLADIIFGLDDLPEDKRFVARDAVYLEYSVTNFIDKSSITSLLGAPPGLLGSDKPGKLIEFLQNQADRRTEAHNDKRIHWIVLLDEVDRAYPTLLEDLRTWMDQGVIRGGDGKDHVARNGIIILCTNVGSGVSVRLKNGETRKSTIAVLNQPVPVSKAQVELCRVAVNTAVLQDLCHNEPPTFGRIKSIALFFYVPDDQLHDFISSWLVDNSQARLRDRNAEDPPVPSGFQVEWDRSVITWLMGFYDKCRGCRSLDYRLAVLISEVNKLLLAIASDSLQAANQSPNSEFGVVVASVASAAEEATSVEAPLNLLFRSSGELLYSDQPRVPLTTPAVLQEQDNVPSFVVPEPPSFDFDTFTLPATAEVVSKKKRSHFQSNAAASSMPSLDHACSATTNPHEACTPSTFAAAATAAHALPPKKRVKVSRSLTVQNIMRFSLRVNLSLLHIICVVVLLQSSSDANSLGSMITRKINEVGQQFADAKQTTTHLRIAVSKHLYPDRLLEKDDDEWQKLIVDSTWGKALLASQFDAAKCGNPKLGIPRWCVIPRLTTTLQCDAQTLQHLAATMNCAD